MSTPFPPNSKLKGLSAYAPPRVRDRATSLDPAETADASAQADPPLSETDRYDYARAEDEQTASIEDASPPIETDALDWLDDAIRAVVDLNHTPASDMDSDLSAPAPSSPSIMPMHDENDGWRRSGARQDRVERQNFPPRPPRLETQIVPPPPPAMRQSSWLGLTLRTSLAIGFAALVAYGGTLFYRSRPDAPRSTDPSYRVAEATPQQTETAVTPQIRAHLIVEDQQAFANDPVPLAVKLEDAAGNESLVVGGLAQGTKLSAGAPISPSSWQLQSDKLAGLYLYAPKDFVGVMNTTVSLLSPDKRLLDSRAMELKWVSQPPPPAPAPRPAPQPAVASVGNEGPASFHSGAATRVPPAVRSIDPAEAALLMQRGRDFLANGDLSAARVAFGRLAEAGMPDAALALANTYDPQYLATHNVVGVSGDRTMARTLYQRAKDLGSAEAARILADMMAD